MLRLSRTFSALALALAAVVSVLAPAVNAEEPQGIYEYQLEAGEHPLGPLVRLSQDVVERMKSEVQDYSATFVKRERVDGELLDQQHIFTKVRHQPFSAYMYFLGPEEKKGREVIYVDGANDGNLLAHEAQGFKAHLGMVRLDPNGYLAMRGQRNPITRVGMLNLTKLIAEVGEYEMGFGECEVTYIPGAKIGERPCTCVQMVHPVPRKEFRSHLTRIFFDDELRLPIRFEGYQWPERAGGRPVLVEEYTYLNLKLNNGWSDFEFDAHNADYNFVSNNKKRRL